MSFAQHDAAPTPLKSRNSLHLANVILIGICLLLIALAPMLFLSNDYYMRVGILICIFTSMSVGWNILGGFANQTSLGHAVYFGMGAYTSYILQLKFHVSPWIGIFIGAGVAVLVALFIGYSTFRLAGHYFALATIAVLQVTNILFTYFSQWTGGSSGLTLPILHNSPGMFQFESQSTYYYISAILMVIVLIIARFVLRSPLGYRLRAIKGNAEAARLAGVNTMKAKMHALIISAAILGVVGGFYAQYMQYIDPESIFSFDLSINMALFAIIGGLGSWWGPILGCLILVPLNQYTSLVLTGQWSPLGEAIYGALLVIVILIKPRGLSEWLTAGWERLFGRGNP
jgi:branched-chain amino acid transport system permease protein